MNYWQQRAITAQERISKKNTKQIEQQLKVYYKRAMDKTITDFEAVYDRLLRTAAKGNEPTPADLYKLDKYWKMQGQLQKELQKLGDRESAVLGKLFTEHFLDVYNSISLPSAATYSTMDYETAFQMIQQIWVADGKSWSDRIWSNTTKLGQMLNDELIHCVVSGKDTNELRIMLHDRFNVSYAQADSLVRTEIAHIQTQAAQKRYEDYGVKEVEVWADEDERRCEICGKLHEKRYKIGEQLPIPAHPRCRCTIIPVIDDSTELKATNATEAEEIAAKAKGKTIDHDILQTSYKAKTLAEANNIAEANGVKYARLDTLSLETANNMNEALNTLPADVRPVFVGDSKTLEKYYGSGFKIKRKPKTFYGMHIYTDEIQTPTDKLNEFGLPLVKHDTEAYGDMVAISSAYKTPEAITKAKKIAQEKYIAQTGRKWFFNTNGEATPYHEIGHVYYSKRGVPESFKWDAARWAEESGVDMLKSESEAWAEAWAAYYTGNKELPDYIAKYIKEAK